MIKNFRKILVVVLALSFALVMTACGGKTTDSDVSVKTTQTGATNSASPTTTNTDMFTERDLDPSYDEATEINLNDAKDGKVTITEKGTYVLSGTLDGQVVVNVDKDDKVQLVLNGVTITNSNSAAIYVQSGDKVFVTLADGTTNKVSSSASFSEADSETGDKVDGTIFSKATLVFNGTGSLDVTSDNGHGIVSKDDIKVTGGTITVNAKKKGIAGKDSIRVHDGTITITSEDDGFHTSNDEDEDKGFIYMEGGTVTISSGDDGMHAETTLTICGGKVDITKSYEGLEGQDIVLSGGDISIVASDDGINASEGGSGSDNTNDFGFGRMGGGGGDIADNQNATLTISGGTITVNAGGDGLDSNGTMKVTGGTTYVSGPTNGGNGAIDCDNATIEGGTVIAAGAMGMDINFGSDSTQCSMLVQFDSTVKGGTEVTLKDSDGNVIASYTPEKDYQSVVISTGKIKTGETYTVTAGSQSKTVEMTSTIYGEGNHMGGGMMGGQGGGMFGGMGGGQRPQNFDNESGTPDAQSSATRNTAGGTAA